jgi:hypothetical protein
MRRIKRQVIRDHPVSITWYIVGCVWEKKREKKREKELKENKKKETRRKNSKKKKKNEEEGTIDQVGCVWENSQQSLNLTIVEQDQSDINSLDPKNKET